MVLKMRKWKNPTFVSNFCFVLIWPLSDYRDIFYFDICALDWKDYIEVYVKVKNISLYYIYKAERPVNFLLISL